MSKRSVIQTNDGYLMLLDAVYFNGRRMGNISEEGLDWGGEDAQTVELWAAQIRTSPVLDIETRAATNEITGKMIEMVPKLYVSSCTKDRHKAYASGTHGSTGSGKID